jgi:hypothetical protein
MIEERDDRDDSEEPDEPESLSEAWERFKRERAVQLPTAPVAPRDTRPRFKNGSLVDEFERLEEELDFELAADPSPDGAEYARANQKRLDRFLLLKTKRDRAKRVRAGRAAGGLTQSQYEHGGRERGAAELRRAEIERRIDELKKALTHMTATRDEQAE